MTENRLPAATSEAKTSGEFLATRCRASPPSSTASSSSRVRSRRTVDPAAETEVRCARRCSCLFQRNKYVMARLTADHSSDVASPRGVFSEHHVAGSEPADRAVAGFDLDLARKRDDILPLRRGVVVAQMRR